jgi:hypothetical protein
MRRECGIRARSWSWIARVIAGLRYEIDRNHDLVYLELDESTINFRKIWAIFLEFGLDPRFIGAIPSELRPRTKRNPWALK